MKFVNATSGEGIYTFLNRVLNDAVLETKTIQAIHNNGIEITVYPESCINDLCDKYDLTMRLSKV